MSPVRLAVLLSCLVFGVPCLARDAPARSAHEVIATLRAQMTKIGGERGRLADFLAAQRAAAATMRELVAQGEPEQLVERDRKGRTPLMEAAYMGYPKLVEALLASDVVRAGIEARDDRDLSAWLLVNLPLQQAMWVCHRGVRNSPRVLAPLMAVQTYYLLSPQNPYREARRLLEQAGAEADMGAARETWQSVCRHQESRTRERIAAADDVLEAVLEENQRVFGRVLAEALIGSRREGSGG